MSLRGPAAGADSHSFIVAGNYVSSTKNKYNMENFITPRQLADALRAAFGHRLSLPLVFGYSDAAAAETPRQGGCLFKLLDAARQGTPVSLHAGNVACGGGSFYTGFADMPERIPRFVSLTEKYKQTPDLVRDFVARLDRRAAPKPYLNFVRLDQAGSLHDMEGLLFYATPDVLCGLAAWTFFDNNEADAVTAPFGSGCSAVIPMAVRENRISGRRVFIALFDPSVRPYVGPDELGFVIPRSRFATMQHTLGQCCLSGTHGWSNVRERIAGGKAEA